MKKLYKNDGIGLLKQFNAPAIIDFFMFPENDFLDSQLGAREFFENVLNQIGWVASRCCYFNISSNLLLFLKIAFSEDMNEYEKLLEDSQFILFKGFEKGPSKGEIEKTESQKSHSPPRESSFLQSPLITKSQRILYPMPDYWADPTAAGRPLN